MRIGIDARLRAYRAGGIAEHVSRLVRGLGDLAPAEAVVVLDHRRAPAVVGAQAAGGFARRRLFTPPHHRLEGWALPVELVPLRLDLLHSPDVVVPRAWRGASVITVHDVAFLRHPEFLTADSLAYYQGIHRAVRRADRIITVSDYTCRELAAQTGADPGRIRVVYNAVDPRYAAPGDPAADDAVVRGHGLEAPFILFVSTIEPRKNVETILEAFRALLGTGRQVGLALAGADGWHSDRSYARTRELGLEGRARFLGFVPAADLAALYRRAAVLAHPAHDEGFGFTPAEAMAAGTPVVVSGAGSLPEVVGEAGLRVAPTDVAAWVAALARVLDEPALAAALAEAGRRQAARFTIERQAQGTLAVYREVLATRAARRRDGAHPRPAQAR
jgi:glycosyltransferase involved in cell wall biosynthesis